MAVTMEDAQRNLDAWVAASEALAAGKEYRIGSRSLSRSDASEVREMIRFWESRLEALGGGGHIRVLRTVPRDL